MQTIKAGPRTADCKTGKLFAFFSLINSTWTFYNLADSCMQLMKTYVNWKTLDHVGGTRCCEGNKSQFGKGVLYTKGPFQASYIYSHQGTGFPFWVVATLPRDIWSYIARFCFQILEIPLNGMEFAMTSSCLSINRMFVDSGVVAPGWSLAKISPKQSLNSNVFLRCSSSTSCSRVASSSDSMLSTIS